MTRAIDRVAYDVDAGAHLAVVQTISSPAVVAAIILVESVSSSLPDTRSTLLVVANVRRPISFDLDFQRKLLFSFLSIFHRVIRRLYVRIFIPRKTCIVLLQV